MHDTNPLIELCNTAIVIPLRRRIIGHELAVESLDVPPEHDELATRTALASLTTAELGALLFSIREFEARLDRERGQRRVTAQVHDTLTGSELIFDPLPPPPGPPPANLGHPEKGTKAQAGRRIWTRDTARPDDDDRPAGPPPLPPASVGVPAPIAITGTPRGYEDIELDRIKGAGLGLLVILAALAVILAIALIILLG